MTSRKNRFLVYLLAALLGVIAVRVVQHIRGEPDGSTPPVTASGKQEDSAEEDNPFAENVPAHDAYDSFMEKLGDDPKFKLLLAGDKQGSGREKGFGLAQDGLPRLTDAQLEQRLVLMSKVVGGMPDGDCQALSRPTVNTADKQRMLDDAIAHFNEADTTAWFDFSLASAKAVLDNTPIAQPDRAAVTVALQKIVQQVPQADRQKFLDATSKPATATPADTCWAMRTLYRNAAALGEPDKAAIARGLVVAVN